MVQVYSPCTWELEAGRVYVQGYFDHRDFKAQPGLQKKTKATKSVTISKDYENQKAKVRSRGRGGSG